MADISGIAAYVYNYPQPYQARDTSSLFSATFCASSAIFDQHTDAVAQGPLTLDLTPNIDKPIVPSSVRFVLNGDTFVDRAGAIYRNPQPQTNAAEAAGTINYVTGEVVLTLYSPGNGVVQLQSLLTRSHQNSGSYLLFRTNGAPIGPASLIVTGSFVDETTFDSSADATGAIVATNVDGNVDVNTGIVSVRFGALDGASPPVFHEKPVLFDSISYNCVLITYLSLDPNVLGLDPTRLPLDGRVPIFRNSQVVVIHHTATDVLPAPLAAGQVCNLSRHPVSKLTILDENGVVVNPALYTADLNAGTITWATPLDLSIYQQPLNAQNRIEDMRLLVDVQIQGQVSISSGVAFNFPANQTKVSSALLFGDLGSRVSNIFTQQTWTNDFEDQRVGADSVGKYNSVLYPLVVDNSDAITERWAIVFTGPTSFQVQGEVSGVIATGDTADTCAPMNPNTNRPYFTIDYRGWGAGWVNNNVLRFNTVSATHPLWIARTIESGPSTNDTDLGRIEGRGDAD